MPPINDKRSSGKEITDSDEQIDWVGGRHSNTNTLTGGGGYQDNYISTDPEDRGSEKKIDPRINELREMQIGRKWLQIAEAIGFDNFMAMWEILDEDNINNPGSACDRVRIWVPTFRRYLRYQRNRYIISRTTDTKIHPTDIKKDIQKQLGESLSITHIQRIMEKAKISE